MAEAAAGTNYSHIQPRKSDTFLETNGISLVEYLKSNPFREYKMCKFKNPTFKHSFEFTRWIPKILGYIDLFTSGPFADFLVTQRIILSDLDKKYLAIVFFYYDIEPEFLNPAHENYKFVTDFIYINKGIIEEFKIKIKSVLVPVVTEAAKDVDSDDDFVDISLPDAAKAKAKYLKYKMKYLQLKHKLKQNK